LDEVREGLQSRGWTLAVEEVWSSEPPGRIVKAEPPIGTMLAAGGTLTLTLSAGSDQPFPLEVNLNNMIFLDSARLQRVRFAPGDAVSVALRWRALQPVSESYTVFAHLIGPRGGLVSQDDHEPRMDDNVLPTNSWTPGVIVVDDHSVDIPLGAVNGTYQLRTGMYLSSNPNQRLPVLNAGRTSQQNDSILIMEIQVGP
jgi:hypothetical protein